MRKLMTACMMLMCVAGYSQNSGLSLQLLLPYDGDTIDTDDPVFIWQSTSGTGISDSRLSMQLIVVELTENQSAGEGIAVNAPVFIRRNLTTNSQPYSSSDYKLKLGTWYAWQVSYLFNGMVVQQSEVSRFIREKPVPPPVSFITLRRQNDGSVYTITGKKLNICTSEKGLLSLKASIRTPKGEVVPVMLTELINGKAVEETESPVSTDTRYFTIDLSDLKLKSGIHSFEWNGSSHQAYTLNFQP